ncbi:hypothetical protein HNR77_003865 [Paenibacillus sp. JGP012]|uniref:BtrH N-terminal domain-containing protein n=1 Tax=Paenibacillus sp. JGP012 TaxID=2735914 RepID=UPI00161E9738|nr:BtrH N-terminal domain-containing protein [Paenibacillus sp. JGP012]MBB6022766.1 hypothetical protein [Paenibacillus sp. JGP012]
MEINKELLIEPFDEIYYRSCFYNPLISSIYYYGGTVFPILAEDIGVYQYIESTSGFQLNERNIGRPVVDILKDMNIHLDSDFFLPESPIESIQKAIQAGTPVFVPIDRYYWKANPEYQKEHARHYFLIIGYDERNFKIIDSRTLDSTSGTSFLNKISFQEVKESVRGWELWDGKDESINITRIMGTVKNGDPIAIHESIECFRNNLCLHYNEIKAGIEDIRKAAHSYANLESLDKINIQNIASDISQLKKLKVIEMFRYKKFFDTKSELPLSLMENTIKSFGLVQGALIKLKVTGKLRTDVVESIHQRMMEIYENELRVLDVIYSYCN